MIHLVERLEPRQLFDAGQIDTTFGSSGQVELTAPTTQFPIFGVDVDSTSNGQPIITGTTQLPTDQASDQLGSVFIWKLRPDGSPDTSFGGGDGMVELPGAAYNTGFIHTLVTSDDGLLVQVSNRIYKLRPNGSRDKSFGTNGGLSLGSVYNNSDIATDASGRIYVPGEASGSGILVIRRFAANGLPDTTYGDHGIYSPPGNINLTDFHSRTLLNGEILIAGRAKGTHPTTDVSFPGFDLDAIRLTSEGSLDTSYGSGGVAIDQIPSTDIYTVAGTHPIITADGEVFITEQQNDNLSTSNTIDSLDSTGHAAGAQVDDSIREAGFTDVIRGESAFVMISGGKVHFDTALEAPIPSQFTPAKLGVQTDGSVLVLSNVATNDDATTFHTLAVHRLYPDDSPLAQLNARTLTKQRNASYRFTIQYRDDDNVSLASLGNDDVTVQLPDGLRRKARLLSTDVNANAKVINATYLITAPDGVWDAADNGTYRVRIERRAVRDTNANAAAQRVIGSFIVQIPASAPAVVPRTANATASFATSASLTSEKKLEESLEIDGA